MTQCKKKVSNSIMSNHQSLLLFSALAVLVYLAFKTKSEKYKRSKSGSAIRAVGRAVKDNNKK